MKLIVNGSQVDLFDGEEIPITFQVSDPEKIESFQSNFSVNFKIPLTPPNIVTFDFIINKAVVSEFPYRFQNVILIQKGFEVLPNCVLFINSYEQDYEFKYLEAQVVQGYFNFFDFINGKSIRQLNLSAHNHNYTRTIMASSQSNTNGFIYEVYERGIRIGLFDVWYGFLSPSVFIKTIWSQIFIDSGFTFEFVDGQPADWDILLLPFCNETRPIQAQDGNFAKQSSGGIEITTPYSVPSIGLLGEEVISFDGSDYPKYNTPNFGDGSVNVGGQFISNPSPDINTYRVFNLAPKVFVKVDISLHFTDAVNVGSPNAIVKVKRGATTIYSENAPNGSGLDYTFKYNGIIELAALEELKITYSVATSGSFAIDRGFFKVDVIDNEALSSGVWEIAPNLPDISQSDFIKAFCLLRGLVPYFEPYEKKIFFYKYNDINLKTKTKPFNLSIDLSKTRKREYKIEGFSQNNFLYYKGKKLKGNFDIDNDLISLNRDVYELPFLTSTHKIEGLNSLIIENYELKNLDEVLEFGDGVAEYDNQEADPIISIKRTPVSGEQTLNIYQNYDLRDTPTNVLIHRSENTNGLDLQFCIDNYHKTFFSISDKAQKETFYCVVPESFLNENILFNPFFVKDLNDHYFVYKIEQWISEKPCKVYAYKLNNLE